MKQYLVTIQSYLPYPIKKEFRINGSSLATASSRAIRKFRKEVGKKKLTELRIEIKTIGKVEMPILDIQNKFEVPQILLH